MLTGKAGAYPKVEHLRGAALLGRLLALPTNIGLGWECPPGTDLLETFINYGRKILYNIVPSTCSVVYQNGPRARTFPPYY